MPTWIIILLNLRLALASTFKFAKKSGALALGKQWTMVAGVSIFTFRTIESPITRALSSGFSVGASLSGENLFWSERKSNVLTRDYATSKSPNCPAARACDGIFLMGINQTVKPIFKMCAFYGFSLIVRKAFFVWFAMGEVRKSRW